MLNWSLIVSYSIVLKLEETYTAFYKTFIFSVELLTIGTNEVEMSDAEALEQ